MAELTLINGDTSQLNPGTGTIINDNPSESGNSSTGSGGSTESYTPKNQKITAKKIVDYCGEHVNICAYAEGRFKPNATNNYTICLLHYKSFDLLKFPIIVAGGGGGDSFYIFKTKNTSFNLYFAMTSTIGKNLESGANISSGEQILQNTVVTHNSTGITTYAVPHEIDSSNFYVFTFSDRILQEDAEGNPNGTYIDIIDGNWTITFYNSLIDKKEDTASFHFYVWDIDSDYSPLKKWIPTATINTVDTTILDDIIVREYRITNKKDDTIFKGTNINGSANFQFDNQYNSPIYQYKITYNNYQTEIDKGVNDPEPELHITINNSSYLKLYTNFNSEQTNSKTYNIENSTNINIQYIDKIKLENKQDELITETVLLNANNKRVLTYDNMLSKFNETPNNISLNQAITFNHVKTLNTINKIYSTLPNIDDNRCLTYVKQTITTPGGTVQTGWRYWYPDKDNIKCVDFIKNGGSTVSQWYYRQSNGSWSDVNKKLDLFFDQGYSVYFKYNNSENDISILVNDGIKIKGNTLNITGFQEGTYTLKLYFYAVETTVTMRLFSNTQRDW